MSQSLTLGEYLANQSPEFQAEVEQGARKLIQQVEDLRAIREVVGMSQTELAARMQTDLGTLSRIERRTDIALRTLRRFVEQVGGELDIIVRLPGKLPMRLDKLSDDRADSPQNPSVDSIVGAVS